MKSLKQYITEHLSNHITFKINEGGHVFGEGSDPIKKEYIKPTIDHFIDTFTKIFPNVKGYFEKPQTLGSVGKKDVSGDIDLAIDEKALESIEDWGLNKEKVDADFAKFKKRARTATDKALMRRAIIKNISEIINAKNGDLISDPKSSGNGVLFCEFPQYDGNTKLDLRVQVDINFGNVDWLKFAYYSDSYKGNVKGLHRTQLMLHMFAYKNKSFNHNSGVKDKETGEELAKDPKAAIELLNKEYGFHLDEKTLQNYHKLIEYLRKHLPEKDFNGIMDIYLKTLDSTRCDIPEDLQEYWIKNRERLGLKGKFLPNDSRLKFIIA